jgi:regulator of protease activity HflC (stomatin/prohibitin superfamily)
MNFYKFFLKVIFKKKLLKKMFRLTKNLQNNFIQLRKLTNETVVKKESLTFLETSIKYGLGIIALPLSIFGGNFIGVDNNHVNVITRFGKYESTIKEGLHFSLVSGLKTYSFFIGEESYILNKTKIIDKLGIPIIVSTVVNYQIIDAPLFLKTIKGSKVFLYNQSESVIKNIISNYPYEDENNDSLKNESDKITKEMIDTLNNIMLKKGIKINNIKINEFSYAPEIASQMLIKQQAEIFIKSRAIITKGTLDLIEDINKNIGDDLSKENKEKLLINLITILTSGNSVTTVLTVEK